MFWWKKALFWNAILLVAVAGLAFTLHQQIQKNAATPESAERREDRLGNLCGQITGAGSVVIWIVAFKRRKR